MDKKVYAISKKDDKAIASGFDHALKTGDNTFSVYFTDGSKVDLTIPLPQDGAKGDRGLSISDASFDANGKLVIELEDGTKLTPLTMPSAAVEVSKQTGNIVTQKADGIYAPAPDLTNYVQKETGKGLSETNVTATMVANWNKAEQNVQPDWAQTDTTKDNYIQNKPTIPTVDSAISATSVNAVENKVVKEELDKKVNVAQGVANKDKFLKVGADGNVALGDVPSGTDIVTAWEATTSDAKVPSEKLVKGDLDEITQELAKKLDADKVVATFSATTSDSKVASEKLVKASLDAKVNIAQTVADKGKALVVGDDGNITLGTVATDGLEIVDKTTAEYNALTDEQKNDASKLYNITDADDLDLTSYAKQSDVDAINNNLALVDATSKLSGSYGNLKLKYNKATNQFFISGYISNISLTSGINNLGAIFENCKPNLDVAISCLATKDVVNAYIGKSTGKLLIKSNSTITDDTLYLGGCYEPLTVPNL